MKAVAGETGGSKGRGGKPGRPASNIDLESNQSKRKERLKAADANEQQGTRHDWIHGPPPRG
jgi:hypothetical protein